MGQYFEQFLRDEQGLTMVEYAIAGALVAAVGAGVFTTLGSNVATQIGSLAAAVLG